MSAVFGNNESNLVINTPDGAFNASVNASWNASGINPAFLPLFPEMADDTYATIGLDGPASTSGIAGAADPSIVEDPIQPVTPYFTTDGATGLLSSTNIGAGWYVLQTDENGLPNSDMRVLVLQVTTTGSISGTINYQVFPLGVGVDDVQIHLDFDGAGTYGGSLGTVNACGCLDSTACNYDSEAEYDDDSCTYIGAEECDCDGNVLDECGLCGGDGIAEGECDCAGNVLDECGICGGSGIAEGECDCAGNVLDECGVCGGDGISDDACDCDGNVLDECGLCGGSGIAEGECDCDGNVVDECGVCGGDGIADGNCDCYGNVLDECGICGGDGIAEGECDCAGNVLDECGVCGGSGIAEGECDCAGNVLDECGICGGDGIAEGECDCDGNVLDECEVCGGSGIAEGECDCDGNVLDECGVCGGDGIADGNCDCYGNVLDECGICGGDGIAEGECDCDGNVLDECEVCGGSGIAEGDCDCAGNVLDECGVCGGDSTSCIGCADENACNYEGDTIDDGSCFYCGEGCESGSESVEYTLTVEASTPAVVPGTTYRFYVDMLNPTDRMSAVFGNSYAHLIVNTPDGAYNNAFNSSWSAAGIIPAFLTLFPDMADDTYATIGLDGPASTSGFAGAEDPSIVEDVYQQISPYFTTDGATLLESSSTIGSSWYVLNTAENGFPNSDMRVLVLQVTTTGSISGTINYQVFPLGVGVDDVQIHLDFDGAGIYGGPSDTGNACGCMDSTACNYDSEAEHDDDSCTYIGAEECDCVGNVLDECGVCGGAGVAEGECDCEGNVLDECGVCGGDGITEGECDCYGNVLDECGVCSGDNSSCTGCMDYMACNYDADATLYAECDYSCVGCMDESAINYDASYSIACLDCCEYCEFSGTLTVGGGSWDSEIGWSLSLNGDEVAVGGAPVITELCLVAGCYIFNMTDSYGDGWNSATYSIDGYDGVNVFTGSMDTAVVGDGVSFGTDYFDFNGGACAMGCTDNEACNYDDAALFEDGSCLAFDECGECGGDGIAEGECDCDGNVLDECGVCGGDGIAEGECDCAGNVLDECGVCGGDNTTCLGCTFSNACNYDPNAIIDDASCVFYCPGCTDPLACNYDDSAIQDDSSCLYPGNGYDCDGICIIDSDSDGVCDENEILGCIEPGACNFNVDATESNSSCEYTSCIGCTYEYACNYDPDALIMDNDSCEFGTCAGCTDFQACNYNPTIVEDDGSCEYCSCSDCTNGCTDIAACNYDQFAYHVESLCLYVDECGICGGAGIAEGECDCDGNQLDVFGVCGGGCLSDINGNNICDNEEVMGCAYSVALNYNPDATIDIGTCEFGEIASDCPSDLSGNGNVGSEDLLIFLADYDLSCDDL